MLLLQQAGRHFLSRGKRRKLASGGRAILAGRACFTILCFPDLETGKQELAFPIGKASYTVPCEAAAAAAGAAALGNATSWIYSHPKRRVPASVVLYLPCSSPAASSWVILQTPVPQSESTKAGIQSPIKTLEEVPVYLSEASTLMLVRGRLHLEWHPVHLPRRDLMPGCCHDQHTPSRLILQYQSIRCL